MQIDKAQVLDMLRGLGMDTTQAARELPDQVDTDEHADLLGKFGISGGELLQQFGGGSAGRDGDGSARQGSATQNFVDDLPAGAAGLRGAGQVGTSGS